MAQLALPAMYTNSFQLKPLKQEIDFHRELALFLLKAWKIGNFTVYLLNDVVTTDIICFYDGLVQLKPHRTCMPKVVSLIITDRGFFAKTLSYTKSIRDIMLIIIQLES